MSNAETVRTHRLLIACILPLLAGGVQWGLWAFIQPLAWFVFFPTVFFAALLGGRMAGFVATGVSAAVGWLVFIPPHFSLGVDGQKSMSTAVLFLLVGCAFSYFRDKVLGLAVTEARRESEDKLLRIFEASPDPIIVTRLDDGVILDVNPAFHRATGFTRGDAYEQTTLSLGLVRDMVARQRFVDALRRDGAVTDVGVWGTCKDGARRHFMVSARRIAIDGVACAVSVMRDTTEAKRAEKALRESEARFQALTRLSSDWYWEQDADFRFTNIAGPLFEHTGIPLQTQLGKTRWEVPSRGMTEEAWKRHKAQLQRHEPFRDLEMQRVGANGESHWVSISGEPIFDGLGTFRGYCGVGRDITERKRQQFVAELGNRVLEMSARGQPLDVVLDTIAREVEAHAPSMLCSILLLDADGLHLRHGAGPSLADEYNRAMDGVTIGPTVGSCGTAAHTRREVVVSDIASDPLWADFRHLALPLGLRACWSTPIFSAAREVLGTFAVYFLGARAPRSDERLTIARVTELAGIVIERDRFEAELLRLSRAIEQSPVSIVITDTEGRIEYVNPKFVATTGYSAKEARGQNPRMLKSGETSYEEYARLWQAITHGRAWTGELHNRRKDGTLFWEQATIMPVVTPAGKIINYLAVKEDITVRKKAEAALRTLAEERDLLLTRLQLEFDHMPIGFAMLDPDLRVIDWNPAMERIFGYHRDEAVGANILDLIVRTAERPFALRHAEEVRRERRTTVVTGLNRKKDGRTIHCEWTDTPLFDADAHFMGMMIMAQDISEKKALEDRDRLRQAQLLHSARLVTMGELASTMAHELNQPLTAIANFSTVALRRLPAAPETQPAREVLEMIAAQALRAGEIVWRMRDFVRTGETSLKPLDINAVIMELTDLAAIQARAVGVTIRYDLAEHLPPVRGNRVQVEQVLLNIVKNGVEAMDCERCGKQLVVRTRRLTQNEVETAVVDEGCGLPEKNGQEVFASFFTTKPDDLGLGLPISRSIVEAHGGRLWCAPNDERGTVFHFTLPVWREDDANE